MPDFSPDFPFANLKRVRQITSSHCGPATVEMLLSFLDIEVSQEEMVEVTGVGHKLSPAGMTVEELAVAVKRLVSQVQFWFKDKANIRELAQIIDTYDYPVGVEWQGNFETGDDDEEEDDFGDEDDDTGHYSVVTGVDTKNNRVRIADPYKLFAGRDRVFTVREFEQRWWDINEVVNPITGKRQYVEDYHMCFVITPKNVNFPEKLGMKKGWGE